MNKIKLILGFTFIVLVFISISQGIFGFFEDSLEENAIKYLPNSQDAYTMTKHFVSEKLKAPSTAKFASENKSKISALGNETWQVVSYVDAQNSFGAMIRTHFTTKVKYIGKENWRLEDYK